MSNLALRDRIESKIVRVTESGCWIWIAGTSGAGYGQLCVNNRTLLAHRVAYEEYRDKLPDDGRELDHLCRVRCCVNPDHLELVSTRENIMRGQSPAARNAKKTHCKNGHEFTPDNTYICFSIGIQRKCRTCDLEMYQKRKDIIRARQKIYYRNRMRKCQEKI